MSPCDVRTEVEKYFKQIEAEIGRQRFGRTPKLLYDPIRYIMSMGGKRVRPLLALLSHALYKPVTGNIVSLAVAIEALHNFTLMHDDVMDHAPLRRGRRTVHKKWNVNTAILSGDAMLVKVYDLLLEMPPHLLKEGLASFNACVTAVCEGQQWDMAFERRERIAKVEYLKMIRQKTAVLLGFSLEFGAFLAEAPSQDRFALRQAGQDIGVGFQLIDDLLDVYAIDQSGFGKATAGDILSNKKTFLWVTALERANAGQRRELLYWALQSDADPTLKIQSVVAVYDALGVAERTQKSARAFLARGLSRLRAVSAPKERRAPLEHFIATLINRSV